MEFLKFTENTTSGVTTENVYFLMCALLCSIKYTGDL